MADLRLRAIITVVDRASGALKGINRELGRIQAPFRNLGRQIRTLDRNSGFQGLRRSIGNVAGEMTRLVGIAAGLATGGLFLLKNTVIDTAAQFEVMQAQLVSLDGSSEKAQQSMDWIRNFAKETPLQLDGVAKAFTQLRTFGLDPMDGTLQALVDQNSKLGGGQERLNGIILAVGQAWTKQKLQGEEALQLIERGVPVWDLLSKISGKTAAQLQEMASKGQLGRDAIRALVREMGKQSIGASAEQMKTFSGITSNLAVQWTEFQQRVADAGIFDLIKEKVSGLLVVIDRMAADGSLQKLAQDISDNLVIIAKGFIDLIPKIGEFFKQASALAGGPLNLLKIGLAGIAAIALGPVLLALVGLFAALVSPVGLVIAAMVAAAAAGVYLTSKLDDLRSVIVPAIQGFVASGVRKLIEYWNIAKSGFNQLLGVLGEFWDKARTGFVELWDGVKSFAIDSLQSIIAKVSEFGDRIKNLISGPFNSISDFFGGNPVVDSPAPNKSGAGGLLNQSSQPNLLKRAGGQEKVSGRIVLDVNSQVPVRTRSIRSDNPGLALDVDSGLSFAP